MIQVQITIAFVGMRNTRFTYKCSFVFSLAKIKRFAKTLIRSANYGRTREICSSNNSNIHKALLQCMLMEIQIEWRCRNPANVNISSTDVNQLMTQQPEFHSEKRGIEEWYTLLSSLIPATLTYLLGPTKTAKLFTCPKTLN